MDNSVMHLEIMCDSTKTLVHRTILEITHERQDALIGISLLPALKVPSHHDVLTSVRLAVVYVKPCHTFVHSLTFDL